MAALEAAPTDVVERLRRAMNRHDLEAFLACFDPAYRSEQPAHPSRGFGGREHVEKNWSALFEAIPDFHAQLLATATEGALFEIEDGRIIAGRLYMEEVEDAGADIDETVRRLAEGTRSEGE